jgi:hypothetical protein
VKESSAAWKQLRAHVNAAFDDWEDWMTPEGMKTDDGITGIHRFQKTWVYCMTGSEPCRMMMFVYSLEVKGNQQKMREVSGS